MNLHTKKSLTYLLTFLLFTGVAIFVYFFIPALRRLNSDKLSVSQLQEKLVEQRKAVEGFLQPTEEEKHLWNDSKQRLKAMCQFNTGTILFEGLTKQAEHCDISDIVITPQSRGERPLAPTDGLPSGVSESKSLLKIAFHADNESLGQFLRWFDEHPHQTSILSLTIKRELPLASVEMEVEAHLLSCDF